MICSMTRLIARLVILAAVLLMPFGMAAAPAAQHHTGRSAMPMSHCPDRGTNDGAKGAFAECTMACAAALPALGSHAADPMRIICTAVQPAAVVRLHGLHPETATPPPKDS